MTFTLYMLYRFTKVEEFLCTLSFHDRCCYFINYESSPISAFLKKAFDVDLTCCTASTELNSHSVTEIKSMNQYLSVNHEFKKFHDKYLVPRNRNVGDNNQDCSAGVRESANPFGRNRFEYRFG